MGDNEHLFSFFMHGSIADHFIILQDVPSGKWDHSGFEEMYGHGSGDGPLPAPERSGKFNRVDLARKVRLHITNLAPTVNSADLNVCFDDVNRSEQCYDLSSDCYVVVWFEVEVIM